MVIFISLQAALIIKSQNLGRTDITWVTKSILNGMRFIDLRTELLFRRDLSQKDWKAQLLKL